MAWFILTLACIILWGVTDVLYKAASNQNDRLAHCKTFVWIGIVMAPAGVIMALCSEKSIWMYQSCKTSIERINGQDPSRRAANEDPACADPVLRRLRSASFHQLPQER